MNVTRHGTVRVLHVADLHGANKTSKTPEKWWEGKIASLASEAPFDAVICSGDVGDNGSLESLTTGFAYLARLCKLAGGKNNVSPRLIITPGNQDVSRPTPDSSEAERSRIRFQHFKSALRASGLSCVCPRMTSSGAPAALFVPPNGGIAVVPICTTWVSGDPAPEFEKKINAALTGQAETTKESVRNALRTDMPFVRTADIDEIEKMCDNQRSRLAQACVRIAVAHHPFWALPSVESTYRGFDIVANGMEVVSRLEKMGFQLLLHGHKHYLGCSLLAGIRNRSGQEVARIQELLSVAGGQMLDPDDRDRFGFQTLSFSTTGADVLDVSIRVFTSKPPRNGVEICRALVRPSHSELPPAEPRRCHTARWMKIQRTPSDEDNHADWQLRYDVVNKLGMSALVQAVDALGKDEHILESDAFLSVAVRSIHEFAVGGSRGVSNPFVRDITGRARDTARGMIFVDVSGNGTWGRPDLIENAASLFRVYIERNHDRLKPSAGPRSWKHRLAELETAATTILEHRASNGHRDELEFDLARILVWDREALYAPSALVLLNLHEVFGVPLFFVDREQCKFLSDVHDCHLEWSDTGTAPDSGMQLNEGTRTRVQSSSSDLQRNWITIKQLLESAMDPSDVKGAKLNWLLGTPIL